MPLPAKQYYKFVFAPARIFFSELEHCYDQLRWSCGLAYMFGAMGAVLQALQMAGIKTPLPPIECLRTNPEVTTGEPSIVVMGVIVVKSFQPLPGLF